MTATVNRRGFLKTGAATAGGLLVSFYLPEQTRLAAAATRAKLNAFVHVSPDDTVTLFIHKAEMGQGTVTSLSMLLAEELECDWSKIRTEFPGVSTEYGPYQGVFGSQSIRTSWMTLRRAGATAREMLIQAAAQQWNVDKSRCRAENGSVINADSNARLSFGSVAEGAAKLPAPSNVTLKNPAQFHLIGKPTKRLDTSGKVNGSARFGLDVRLPEMLHAVVERSPVFGGKVATFDATKTKTIPGVKEVVPISNGVAVVADNTWSAMEGRRVLQIKWDEGAVASVSSTGISKNFVEYSQKPGAVARKTGDSAAALQSASKKVEAVYETPFLAHAPMEPLNCVAHVRADACEVWASTQGQSAARDEAVRITGLAPDKVKVYSEFMGGGFGRRARADYIGEAVEVSKAIGAPVQVTWSREDDLQQDFYRPAAYGRFTAGLDADGWPTALSARLICPPFGGLSNGVARTGVEGIVDLIYSIPNVLVDYHALDPGIPVSYWRSVGYSQNTFFLESFIDEIAHASGKDPLELRLRLLQNAPRLKAVLELAADKFGWSKPLPAGHGRGIAVVNNIGSFTAQVVEASIDRGKLRVHRVVCAVDCGYAVNPSGIDQQIRSGIVFGLSALKGGITIDRGRVLQQNFHQYDVLHMDEMPSVEVHVLPTPNNPGGIGEASTPGIVPAVANAIFAATGKRIRKLPVSAEELA
ncbi:MAG TPA: xanthine dehydrogenase family protein molybdopterin-binding subunit [Bryobacteraceae bacterium]|nr:xanthine dehydrogenase family protein molybdopterin-binding subunit [Bryobacteraceae bacterium]